MKKIILLLLACFITFGCGSSDAIKGLVPCAGTITLDGEPLDGASIRFAPVNSSGQSETERRDGTAITSKGNFTIKTSSSSSGIAPGSYKVIVHKMVDEKTNTDNSSIKNITGKYSDIETSDLTVEIPSGGNKGIKLELKLK
jgi:hypothetical protein